MSTRITIRHVAKAAGVSVTTVSDSLSGKGRLPDETRKKVLQTAKELGYQASSAAKSLASGRTGIIMMSIAAPGTAVTSMWNVEFFVRVMSAASEVASAKGYALAMAPLGDWAGSSRLPYDGAIVVDPVKENTLVQRALVDGRPLVTVGRLDSEATSCVDNDFSVIVPEVLDHLWQQGARRPALISSPVSASYAADCVRAYRNWCSANLVEPLIEVVSGSLSEDTGRQAAVNLLSRTEAPDAIFATLDRLALGASMAATAERDVMIVSLGDSSAAAGASVPLTAVELNPVEIGRAAAEMLIEQIEGKQDIKSVTVPAHLVVRASTGARPRSS
ncbi:DNA-binding transcriptional regulator, LacI/PurR family [Arthrobacter sp. ok909]|nr:DNA-binding transcriptional regulator, LacI/PurR family [Arthrobacter sp. ok909]